MFELFFKHVECLRERTDTEEPSLPRKRKAPKHIEVGEGDGYHSPTIEDHYRQCYFEALDLAISSIQERFDQPGYVIYQNLEELLLKAASVRHYSSELQYVIGFYGNDFNESELCTQLQILTSSVMRENQPSKSVTLREVLSFEISLKANEHSSNKYAG